jgi:hypothetical protein
LDYYGKRLTPKRELLLKLVVSNFRMMSVKISEIGDEIFDLLNQIDDMRRTHPIIFHNFDQLYIVLEIFFKNLAKNLNEKFLENIDTALRNYLKGFVNKEVNIEMLRLNLRFVLDLTNNLHFMNWAKEKKIDLFKIMKYNKNTPYMAMDIVKMTAKIHHNLLINYHYASKFLYNASKIQQTVEHIMDMESAGVIWLKNIVLLSYIKPRGLSENISSFLVKITGLLYKELEKEQTDWETLNEILSMLRRFCSNAFKAENETLIRQV